MGKKRRDRQGSPEPDWASERTLADAEADAAGQPPLGEDNLDGGDSVLGVAAVDPGLPFADDESTVVGDAGRTDEQRRAGPGGARCACGSEEFVLEAYLAVIRGRPQREPLELESLTCPQCGREYEAIWLADGTVARGELQGRTELDDE